MEVDAHRFLADGPALRVAELKALGHHVVGEVAHRKAVRPEAEGVSHLVANLQRALVEDHLVRKCSELLRTRPLFAIPRFSKRLSGAKPSRLRESAIG